MDTKRQNERSAREAPIVAIVHRRELHYSCGCTTTQIESGRQREGNPPGCDGHAGVLLKKVETTEYSFADLGH